MAVFSLSFSALAAAGPRRCSLRWSRDMILLKNGYPNHDCLYQSESISSIAICITVCSPLYNIGVTHQTKLLTN
jgi:hypothetical protein